MRAALMIPTMLCCVGFALVSISVAQETKPTAGPGGLSTLFDNGVGRGQLSPKSKRDILAELGYSGIAYSGTHEFPGCWRNLTSMGSRWSVLYVGVQLGPEQSSYDPGLPEAIAQLEGRGTSDLAVFSGRRTVLGFVG